MGLCVKLLLLPVGVTLSTVEGILRATDSVDVVVTVTVEGLAEEKKEILEAVSLLAKMMGADYSHVTVQFRNESSVAELYTLLMRYKPVEVVVSFLTGSRYLIPIMLQVLLRIWNELGTKIMVIHGVEGDGWFVTPLPGFVTYELNRKQKEIFMTIYAEEGDEVDTKAFMKKHGLSRTAYKTLKLLEHRGLIERRRGKILKTFPGKSLYKLLILSEVRE